MVAAAAVLACLGMAPAAPASLKSMWGANELPNGRSAFPMYERLGVDVLQRQLAWSQVATSRPADPRDPDDPAYRWPADLERAVRQARRHDMRIGLLVKQTPGWANGGAPVTQAPDDPGDYADFLVAVSRRYPRVRHWMIWGEPSRRANWTPLPSNSPEGPQAYARLLDRAYGALKAHNRRNIVIGAMTYTIGEAMMPPDWVRWMKLPDGRPPRMDWWGHNAFVVRKPDLAQRPYYPGLRDFSDLDTFRGEIRRAYRGRPTPKFWISEFAVSSDRANRAFSFYVSRRAQAAWLRAAYRIAHRTPWIAGVGWYKLTDDPGERGITTGLLDTRGKAKPAYYAYKRAR